MHRPMLSLHPYLVFHLIYAISHKRIDSIFAIIILIIYILYSIIIIPHTGMIAIDSKINWNIIKLYVFQYANNKTAIDGTTIKTIITTKNKQRYVCYFDSLFTVLLLLHRFYHLGCSTILSQTILKVKQQ